MRLYDASRSHGGRIGIVTCKASTLRAEGFLPQTYMEAYDIRTT